MTHPMAHTNDPATCAEPSPTPNEEELPIEIDLADILPDDDVETTRISDDEAQKLVDAAFGAAR